FVLLHYLCLIKFSILIKLPIHICCSFCLSSYFMRIYSEGPPRKLHREGPPPIRHSFTRNTRTSCSFIKFSTPAYHRSIVLAIAAHLHDGSPAKVSGS